MRRSRLVFWLGEASPHVSGYLRALAELLPQTTLIGVFQGRLQPERLALGWRTPDLGRVDVVTSPDGRALKEIALCDSENSIHIFGGMRLPMIRHALRICACTKGLIGIASEGRDWQGPLGRLRLLHSYIIERPYRNRVDFVLAVGHSGVRWYQMCGYPPHRIFPWGYVVERPSNESSTKGLDLSARVVISYVGRCIRSKGIDTLLGALAMIPGPTWRLQIVGDGPQRERLQELARKLGIEEHVSFLGIRENAEIWRILQATDLLVQPSWFDGWSAVINEALMSGVPVVCSDRCGAADLVREGGYGEVFRVRSTEDLTSALRRWISKGPLDARSRGEILAWSKCIEGEPAARYLIQIIEHIEKGGTRPVAPWLRQGSTA